MLTRVEFICNKLLSKSRLEEVREDMSKKHKIVLFNIHSTLVSDHEDENYRYYIHFTTYGSRIYVTEVLFSVSGYAEYAMKNDMKVDELISEDIQTINDFIDEPNIFGTDIPQFAFFTPS